MYRYYFYTLISICVITFFDVHMKLNNRILQCYDLKCTYEIEPLKFDYRILQSSNILFSKCDQFLNNIWITITHYDKHTNSNNHILK